MQPHLDHETLPSVLAHIHDSLFDEEARALLGVLGAELRASWTREREAKEKASRPPVLKLMPRDRKILGAMVARLQAVGAERLPLPTRELADAAGLTESSAGRGLRELRIKGAITRSGGGHRKPYFYAITKSGLASLPRKKQ